MQTGQPSRTALGAARYRAEHQELDGGRIFRDPLARTILGDDLPPGDHLFADGHERMRGFIATRARFAEDALAEAVREGTGQAVILGAGLDTFAYRNPYPALRVFEVDHPDTQAWKRERLSSAGIAIPESVTYVPVDFERQPLDGALTAADFDATRPAFVIWLGVTVYLTRTAIEETLGHLGRLVPGSRVIIDYGVPRPESSPRTRATIEERERRLAAIGERWISFFTPDEMARLLRGTGFEVEEDLPAVDLALRYLGREPAAAAGPHLVRARVPA
ncbi:methyltransferase (TIGR00027 family) [Nocardia transvalensis]|uniref:S-adenosyl-L-methionine-dependent methyltransferase n=1 Tax=Nocardia transvalensis TaxID=37333 RepID=A0A7W9PAJ2_9NOCA|nr:SAM-dependent methyltransferase [Nocardia transvalensis]MBB5912400.1 methyltransferase (TIGR00027 family) [Nocardia transvalensis]